MTRLRRVLTWLRYKCISGLVLFGMAIPYYALLAALSLASGIAQRYQHLDEDTWYTGFFIIFFFLTVPLVIVHQRLMARFYARRKPEG